MNSATEKKPMITLDKKATIGKTSVPAAPDAPTITTDEKLKASIQ